MSLFPKRNQNLRRRNPEESGTLRHIVYGVLLIIVIVLVGTAVWYITRLDAVTIKTVRIEGGETISHEQVSGTVEDVLKGNYVLLVPYRFAYLYPRERIIEAINGIPRAHDAAVVRSGPTTLDVTFEEYVPSALWCLTATPDSPCFFMTEDGYAFAPAPELEGGSLTRHILEQERELRETQILSKEEMETMRELLTRFESELSLRVIQVVHTAEGDLELSIKGGGRLLVEAGTQPEKIIKNLRAVLASKEFKHLAPGDFNYIDLRFGNKVFVNEERTEATSTEAVATST